MVTHMKTTIDIPDALYEETRRLAARRGATVRSVVLGALRREIEAEPERRSAPRLRKHPFHGEGLQPGIEEGDWSHIRALIYEGHGG